MYKSRHGTAEGSGLSLTTEAYKLKYECFSILPSLKSGHCGLESNLLPHAQQYNSIATELSQRVKCFRFILPLCMTAIRCN